MMGIVEELRRDRESGAKRLVSEYKAGLMTLARKFFENESDAEELVNATFAKVVENIDSYLEQSAFFSWMCQILTNEYRQSVRRKSNKVEIMPSEMPDAVDDGAQRAIFDNLDATLLRDAIEQLPEDIRKAVILHYFMDIPVREAAKILTIPTGTMAWRLHQARQMLAAKLGGAAKKFGGKALLRMLLLLPAAVFLGRFAFTGNDATPLVEELEDGTLSVKSGVFAMSQPRQGRIWIGEGATLDLNGHDIADCDVVLAGGKITSTKPAAHVTLPRRMNLTADSGIIFANIGGNHDMSVPKGAEWNLGGCTLNVVLDGFDPDLCMEEGETISNGTLKVAVNSTAHDNTGRGWVQFANLNGKDGLRLDLGNSILRLKHHAPNMNSTVCDFTCRPPRGETIYSGNQLEIYGVYKPQSTDGFNIKMMDGSTLDLSDQNVAWNCKFRNSGGYAKGSSTECKVSFAAGATVNVNLGGRADLKAFADSGRHIILWAENAVPDVDLTAIVDELASNDYAIANDGTGAWVRRMGGLVIIVNFKEIKRRRKS